MSALAEIVECSAATLAGPNRHLLCLQGEPVATLCDPESVAALVARVPSPGSLPELIGTLVATRPTGALVLGAEDGAFSIALGLREGRVISAIGPEDLQSMGTWVVELHRRYSLTRGNRASGDDAALVRALNPGRTFVVESVHEGLTRCDHRGASLLLLQGESQWLHEQLDFEGAPELGFLLMDYARRGDELQGVESAFLAGGGVIVPRSRPGKAPRTRPTPAANSEWDFFDDPDPAAETEWLDARFVFDFCDGVTELGGIVERTMLGRFRTTSALLALLEREHVQLAGEEPAEVHFDFAS